MKPSELETVYQSNSIWKLDFDLREVHEWYVRRDTLYVKHNADDGYVEYLPWYSAGDDHDFTKHPIEHYVDGVFVDFKKSEYHNPLQA